MTAAQIIGGKSLSLCTRILKLPSRMHFYYKQMCILMQKMCCNGFFWLRTARLNTMRVLMMVLVSFSGESAFEVGVLFAHPQVSVRKKLVIPGGRERKLIECFCMQKNGDQPNLPLVQNVVSFAKMNIENDLDLKSIAQKVEGCRYNKKRFPAVIMRKTKPKSTILVFKSGRMIIIGSESEADAEQAARRSIKDIQKSLSTKLKMVDFRVTNIVANADLGCKIDIGKLCEERNVVRNENFPGVVYKQMEHVKSALIFASGKVVFTGAKNKDSIDNAFNELKRKMEKFRKS